MFLRVLFLQLLEIENLTKHIMSRPLLNTAHITLITHLPPGDEEAFFSDQRRPNAGPFSPNPLRGWNRLNENPISGEPHWSNSLVQSISLRSMVHKKTNSKKTKVFSKDIDFFQSENISLNTFWTQTHGLNSLDQAKC